MSILDIMSDILGRGALAAQPVIPGASPPPSATARAAVAADPNAVDVLTTTQRRVAQAVVQVFETGRFGGHSYGSVSNTRGDTGGLSYGSHQVSLTSGNLYLLLRQYCDRGGQYGSALQPYMARIANRDRSVGDVPQLQSVLKSAGDDPVMRRAQDDFFDEHFWRPAAKDVQVRGFKTPLAYALSFDGHIQGGWGIIAPRVSRSMPEKQWCARYAAERKSWLLSGHGVLPSTVYRMDTFLSLIAHDNWDLTPPFVVHGFTLTPAMFS